MKQIVVYKNQSKLRNFILMLRGNAVNGYKYVLWLDWKVGVNSLVYDYYAVGDEVDLRFSKVYFVWELGQAVAYIDDSVKNDNYEEGEA